MPVVGSVKSIVPRPAVPQIDLALDHVGPGRRVGVLEVGHEDLGAGIERVDDHLAVDRAGDLDAAVQEVGRDRRDLPVALAECSRLGQEIGQLAGVEALLALLAPLEQALRVPLNSRCRSARKASAAGVRISSWREPLLAVTAIPSCLAVASVIFFSQFFTCGTVYVAPHPHSLYELVRSLSKAT